MVDNDSVKNLSMEEIIKVSTPVIVHYCYLRINRNYHDAEDIANEVMEKFSIKWAFVKKDKIMSWLYKTANIYIKRHRQKAKNKLETTSIEDLPSQSEPSQEDDYNAFLFDEDIQRFIKDIHKRLPIGLEQDLFKYRYMEKKTLSVITNITGIPHSTLRDRYESLDEKIKILVKELIENSIFY